MLVLTVQVAYSDESKAISKLAYFKKKSAILEQVYNHKDKHPIEVLNSIRTNRFSPTSIKYLGHDFSPFDSMFCTWDIRDKENLTITPFMSSMSIIYICKYKIINNKKVKIIGSAEYEILNREKVKRNIDVIVSFGNLHFMPDKAVPVFNIEVIKKDNSLHTD